MAIQRRMPVRSRGADARRGAGVSRSARERATAALRTAIVLSCAAVFGPFALGAPADGGVAGAPRARLGAGLELRLETAQPGERLAVQVMLRKGDLPPRGQGRNARIRERQARVLAALSTHGFELRRRYHNLSGLALRATPGAIGALVRHPEVEYVYLDRSLRASMTQGVPLIGGDIANAQGFTGSGVNVALIDSGIDSDHNLLLNALVAEHCFCDDQPGPNGCCPNTLDEDSGAGSAEDDEGHGTSMAGVITSNRGAGPGVAPDSGIVAVKVIDSTGHTNLSDVAMGLDWVLSNYATYDVGVVNMSLGDQLEHDNSAVPPCSGSLTDDAAQALFDAGVVVFAASGNEGFDAGISMPACSPAVISVGAVYDETFPTIEWVGVCTDTPATVDTYVCHSNSGSLLEILAPSYRANTPKLGGGSIGVGGTSVASAYASGEAAVLLSADPTLTPTQIRSLLTGNGPLVTVPDNMLQIRRSDLGGATAEVLQTLDSDTDGILDDGDGSGVRGDAPCVGGETVGCDDNCVDVLNPTQADADADGQGDPCDPCPLDPQDDGDADGLCADLDNCPAVANAGQEDADSDGIGDACDICPLDPQGDLDGDGVCRIFDNCPSIANPGQADTDQDGRGDACDYVLAPAVGPAATALLCALLLLAGLRWWRPGASRPRC